MSETRMAYVRELKLEHTGGGIMADVIVLDDGTVLAITDDAVGFYRDLDHWHDNSADPTFIYWRHEDETEAG